MELFDPKNFSTNNREICVSQFNFIFDAKNYADESRSGLEIYAFDILLKTSRTVALTCRHWSKDRTMYEAAVSNFQETQHNIDIIYFVKIL